jgi:hypothetical protein
MRMAYVFNPQIGATGYLCRLPLGVAKVVANHVPYYDYDKSPLGILPDPNWSASERAAMSTWNGWRHMITTLVTKWER